MWWSLTKFTLDKGHYISVIDIACYGGKCKTLVCFIYDKGSFLSNPYGIISDLEGLAANKVQVKVYIAPI